MWRWAIKLKLQHILEVFYCSTITLPILCFHISNVHILHPCAQHIHRLSIHRSLLLMPTQEHFLAKLLPGWSCIRRAALPCLGLGQTNSVPPQTCILSHPADESLNKGSLAHCYRHCVKKVNGASETVACLKIVAKSILTRLCLDALNSLPTWSSGLNKSTG